MDAAELKKLATSKGLPPIPVSLPDDDLPRPPRFAGTLDEFWAAATTLGAKALFISIGQMDESDFERLMPSDDVSHIEEDENDGTFDGENYTVSLEGIRPSISRFRKHVGKDCAFVLVAKGGVAEIDYLLTETWWDEFQEEADKAVESWLESRNARYEDVEAANQEKTGKLLESLSGLINDRNFCLLRTHRARITYAIDKLPELSELDEFVLKPEIQKLADRIEAKRLNLRTRD